MGVAGDFLPRVLDSSGRTVDLRDYKDGVCFPAKNKKRHHNCNNKRNKRKRPLRIGIDVSAWIYRAGFAFGEKLMHDERHLTYYGRAQQQQQQQQQENRDWNGHHPTQTNNDEVLAEKIRDYCDACANYVVRRLEFLKEGTSGDLLVVFDGRTPPIKTATVSQRKKSRAPYQSLREDNNAAASGDALFANQERQSNSNNNGNGNENGNTKKCNNSTTNIDVEADIEQRVKANRRAGPGRHVSRIVDSIIEKLRERNKLATTIHQGTNRPTNHNNYLASWMVAPYEADSQLAYLSKQSYIDLVITEDTDLIAHGCRSVLYKCLENSDSTATNNNNDLVNNNNTNTETSSIHIDITRGKLIEFWDLGGTKVFSKGPSKPDLTDFTPVMMAVLFVLLGCDYNGHRKLKGIGILKACKIVRKAFLLESSERSQQQHESKIANSHLSILDLVWKEAYEQSYESNSFYTEDFKREYQKSFVEALWMYRHPIVFDPMIQDCIQCPSPVSNNDLAENEIEDNNNNNTPLGDPELLEGCREYMELSSDPIRIMQVVGEIPPTQEECIAIAEGRSHAQWKLRKPTPIYSNNNNNNDGNIGNNNIGNNIADHHIPLEGIIPSSKTDSLKSRKKRKSPVSTTPSSLSLSSSNKKKNSIGHKKRTNPAFQSKRRTHLAEKENNHSVPMLLSSGTQSDRRRSLESDEIASVAAGGYQKDDRRPQNKNQNGIFSSRNLFPGEQQHQQQGKDASPTKETPRREPKKTREMFSPSIYSYASSSHESEKTVPLSATPEKGRYRGLQKNNTRGGNAAFEEEEEDDEEPRSPNLLASTTPEHSTQSSSKAATLSINASGTESSTKTLSQSQKASQSQSQSQSSSKMSVDLLASSATSTHSNGFATQTQWETPMQLRSKPQYHTPVQTSVQAQSQSRSQSPNFSTQEEETFLETQQSREPAQPKLDSQSPAEDEALFTQAEASPFQQQTQTPTRSRQG